MSSAGANQESQGGTMKNVIDNPETKPESRKYAEDQSNTHTDTQKGSNQGNPPITSTNQESQGGTMKNVIDTPGTKPESHKHAEDQSKANTQQTKN